MTKTTYRPIEVIIVDNLSSEAATSDYLSSLSSDERVRVLPYPQSFNFSAINNFAVAQAQGSVIALVNNDVEVISPGWLDEMVGHACRPEIGCVGAKLYYPDETIQHAGIVVGMTGIAGHPLRGLPRSQEGYFGRAVAVCNVSAVTAACLVVRRSVYEEVGGLDENDLAIAFNDVDFCLKVQQRGYLNLWTPFAEFYHYESVSRGREQTWDKAQRFAREINVMRHRWHKALLHDPYYSPHLSLSSEDYAVIG